MLSYFDFHSDIRCFLEDESKLRHSSERNFVVKMGSHTIDFFFYDVYLSCRIGKTRRRKVRSFGTQVGQRTPSQASNVHGWLRMESFCGHSRGNSIRHTKSSAQDASRNSTLSLNSASLKLAWLDILFSFFSLSCFLYYKF